MNDRNIDPALDLSVDTLHQIREEHAAEFDFDLHKICEHYRQRAEKLRAEGREILQPPEKQDIQNVNDQDR